MAAVFSCVYIKRRMYKNTFHVPMEFIYRLYYLILICIVNSITIVSSQSFRRDLDYQILILSFIYIFYRI